MAPPAACVGPCPFLTSGCICTQFTHAHRFVSLTAGVRGQVRLTRLFKRLFMECIGGATQPIRIGGVSLLGSTVAYLLHILFAMAVFSNFLGCLW